MIHVAVVILGGSVVGTTIAVIALMLASRATDHTDREFDQ